MKRSSIRAADSHPLLIILSAPGMRPIREAVIRHLTASEAWALGDAAGNIQLDVPLVLEFPNYELMSAERTLANSVKRYWNAGAQEMIIFCQKKCIELAGTEFHRLCRRMLSAPKYMIVDIASAIFQEETFLLPCHGAVVAFWEYFVIARDIEVPFLSQLFIETIATNGIAYIRHRGCCCGPGHTLDTIALEFFWDNVVCRCGGIPNPRLFDATVFNCITKNMNFSVFEKLAARGLASVGTSHIDWARIYNHGWIMGSLDVMIGSWRHMGEADRNRLRDNIRTPSILLFPSRDLARLLEHLCTAFSNIFARLPMHNSTVLLDAVSMSAVSSHVKNSAYRIIVPLIIETHNWIELFRWTTSNAAAKMAREFFTATDAVCSACIPIAITEAWLGQLPDNVRGYIVHKWPFLENIK